MISAIRVVKFQEINYANSVLCDETKKAIYDKYGMMGLRLADQMGEENVKTYMLLGTCWCKVSSRADGLLGSVSVVPGAITAVCKENS